MTTPALPGGPKRVLCFGEILLRLAAPGRELLLQTPRLDVTVAGAEANVAVALASFGHDARMLSVVPDTVLGRAAISEVRRHGVDVRGIKFGPGRMGLYFLTHGAVRRPSEIIYDRTDSAFARAPGACADDIGGADWLHLSGVTPALGPASAAAAIAAVRTAQDKGIPVSFDGNFRTKLWEARRSEAPEILRQMFAHADIVFGDDRDIALVLGKSFGEGSGEQRRERAAVAAFEAFPKLKRIACTIRVQHSVDNHELGAVMFTRQQVQSIAPVELSSIVDRVGTGDAFAAGVLHGLLGGESDREALRLGLAATCLKHSIQGDFLTLGVADVRAAMANEGLDVRR